MFDTSRKTIMDRFLVTVIVFSVLSFVQSETIHFTNSPNHLVRSKNYTAYKLDVPGSGAITIIEANNHRPQRFPTGPTGFSDQDFSKYQKSDAPPAEPNGPKKMVYAPALLSKFMDEYNAKLQSTSPTQVNNSYGDIIIDRNDALGPVPSPIQDFTVNKNDRQHAYGSHPYNDKQGWVTLEAVPWSKSQVSKWKPNQGQQRPTAGGVQNYYRKALVSPIERDYHTNNWSEEKTDEVPKKRPHFYGDGGGYNDRTVQTVASRPLKLITTEDDGTLRKPAVNYVTYKQQLDVSKNGDRWYDYGFRPNFEENRKPWNDEILVADQSNVVRVPSRRRPQSSSPAQYGGDSPYSDMETASSYHHPANHPTSGNGEWVLVSTTKGYQLPSRRVQRGMNFSSPSGYKTKKSVKLHVLPPKPDSDTKMTTSHGGLLEVESSQQSVEASAANAAAAQGDAGKKKKLKRKTAIRTNKVIHTVPVENKDSVSDSSAVFAAVSAGMVPATVAMLMPMVLGRKRRSLQSQPHFVQLTPTLQYIR